MRSSVPRSTAKAIWTCVLTLAACALLAGPAGAAATDREIARQIRRLGDEDFDVREAASKWLWEQGDATYHALVKAAEDRDPEVVWRAQDILRRLRSGVTAETPKDIAKLLTSCHTGEDRERRRVLERFPWDRPEARKGLMRQYKFAPDAKSRQELVSAIRPRSAGARAFLRTCYKEDNDAETRKAVARALGSAVRPILTSLLMKEKTDEVERLLSDAMSERNRTLMYDWVALTALTGKLDAKIKEYEKRAEEKDKLATEILGRLKRARGDEIRHPAPPLVPEDCSAKTNDAHWRKMAAEREASPLRDFVDAVKKDGETKQAYSCWHYAELAIYYRLAGEKKKAQEAVARMRTFVGKTPRTRHSSPWHPIKAMVVADASGEAVDELLRRNSVQWAHQVREAQGRYAEADALLRERADDDREDIPEDRVYMAGCLLALGDKKRAARLAKLAAQELAVRDPENAEAKDLLAKQRARLDLIPVLRALGKQELCDRVARTTAETLKSEKTRDYGVDSYAADVLTKAGYRDMVSDVLRHWAAQSKTTDQSRAARAALRAGLRELAFKLCALDLQEIIDASRRDKERDFHTHSYVMVRDTLENLFPKKRTAASVCLDALVDPDDDEMTGANVVKSFRKALEATQGADAFLAIVRKAEKKASAGPAPRARALDFLAKACREMGQKQEAKRLDRKSMAGSPSSALAMREGDRLREAGRWADAAAAYAKAWRPEQGGVISPQRPPFRGQLVASAGPLFLQGWSLVKAGKNTEGRRLMRLAKIVPLGDSSSRLSLAQSMDKLGLHKDADRQRELATRVGAKQWNPFAQRDTNAPYLLERSNWAAAERIYVGEVRRHLTTSGLQGVDKDIFGIATLPGLIEVREMLANGRVDEAMKIIRESLRVCPANTRIPALFVYPLEKLGRKKEADEIFGIVFRALSERCRRRPDGTTHNSLAWVCAVCARELDVALEHAKEATGIEKGDSSCLDTLAEVHLQRGEFDKARACARKAWVSAPFRAFIRRRWVYFSRPDAALENERGSRPPSISMQ